MSDVFAAILPVFLAAGVGYLAGLRFSLDVKTLTTLNVYVLLPLLIFESLYTRDIDWGAFGGLAMASLLCLAVMLAALWVAGRFRGLAGRDQNALLMTAFMNLGNFGLPVAKFAFGDEGLAYAVLVLLIGSFLQNSIAIYLAQHQGGWKGVVQVFRLPIVYAFLLAFLFQQGEWGLPTFLARTVTMFADAAIPLQLLILGTSLAQTKVQTGVDVMLATGLRLVAGPLVAALSAFVILRLDGLPAKVFVLLYSGPVAVSMVIYAIQFDIRPRFISSVVFWSFLLSLGSVTAVLWVLFRI